MALTLRRLAKQRLRAGKATSGSLWGEASRREKAGRKSEYPYSRLLSENEDPYQGPVRARFFRDLTDWQMCLGGR